MKRWREAYALYAVVGYLVAVYAVLTVLPRYLFPAEIFLWVFAAAGLIWTRDRIRERQRPASVTPGSDRPHT